MEVVLRWMDRAEEKGRRDVRMRMTLRVGVSLSGVASGEQTETMDSNGPSRTEKFEINPGHSEMRIEQTCDYLNERGRCQHGPPNVRQTKR